MKKNFGDTTNHASEIATLFGQAAMGKINARSTIIRSIVIVRAFLRLTTGSCSVELSSIALSFGEV